jgi:hypothetical protein
MVGDDKTDLVGKFAGPQLFESALWAENSYDKVANTLEYGLASRRLDGVVIDEENGRCRRQMESLWGGFCSFIVLQPISGEKSRRIFSWMHTLHIGLSLDSKKSTSRTARGLRDGGVPARIMEAVAIFHAARLRF